MSWETGLLLEVRELDTAYGASQVLFALSFSVNQGEAVSLLGRNGMGETAAIERTASDRVARMGIAVLREGQQIFPSPTVRENLTAFAGNRSGRADPWT